MPPFLSFLGSPSEPESLPWAESFFDDTEAFWKPQEIEPSKWEGLFPYRLLVWDIERNAVHYGSFVGPLFGPLLSRLLTSTGADGADGLTYVLTGNTFGPNWEARFPITPQQLQIQDQFAINTTATMRGIVEEHNGIKFKLITAQGTTGVFPEKPTIPAKPAPGIFGGIIEGFNNLVDDFARIARAFSGGHPEEIKEEGESPSPLYTTGYYQAMYIGQFLERYAQLKKDPTNKNLRLVFDIPKQNQSFIVTPISFSLNQNANKPMEYIWNIQLKAWKRIKLDQPFAQFRSLPSLDTGFSFSALVNGIAEIRRTVSNFNNLIKAVRSDFQKFGNLLRQTSLLLKDVAGAVSTVGDLPQAIINDAKSAILEAAREIANLDEVAKRKEQFFDPRFFQPQKPSVVSSFGGGRTSSGVIVSSTALSSEGLSNNQIKNGALGSEAAQNLNTDPTNDIFENPEDHFDILDEIPLDSVNLTPQQQELIERDLEEIRSISVEDLKDFKKEFLTLAEEIGNSFGAGDEEYSQIYNRPTPKKRVTPLTLEENELLAAIFELIQIYDALTATSEWDDSVRVNSKVNSLDFVGGLASESGIPFEVAQSKLLVPVPFGLTIEEIAARYLGNADKWVEIATINSLTSPYIDEDGFTYDFLSNGSGRQFNINDIDKNIYIGQKVFLFSNSVKKFTRKVTDLEKIDDNNFLVTVDGDDNLDSLTLADNAKITGYLPGTVNSQNQIYIPTNTPSQGDDGIRVPNHLDEDQLTKISKIDWLIDDRGDLVINKTGDINLSNGLTNLVQALKLKVRTKKGTLLRHLDYGFGIQHGVSIADLEGRVLFNELNNIVADDQRFEGITRLDIRLSGATLGIDMTVSIANGSGVVPISFDI